MVFSSQRLSTFTGLLFCLLLLLLASANSQLVALDIVEGIRACRQMYVGLLFFWHLLKPGCLSSCSLATWLRRTSNSLLLAATIKFPSMGLIAPLRVFKHRILARLFHNCSPDHDARTGSCANSGRPCHIVLSGEILTRYHPLSKKSGGI